MKLIDKEMLIDYLKSQALMALATGGEKGSLWSATVYFATDKDLNFYFMSGSDSLHCKNIKDNQKVSFAIADSNQWPQNDKFGVQASGECHHVYNIKEIMKILKVWNLKFEKKPAPPLKKIKLDSPFYKIVPDKIKIFDSTSKGEKEKILDL